MVQIRPEPEEVAAKFAAGWVAGSRVSNALVRGRGGPVIVLQERSLVLRNCTAVRRHNI